MHQILVVGNLSCLPQICYPIQRLNLQTLLRHLLTQNRVQSVATIGILECEVIGFPTSCDHFQPSLPQLKSPLE